jgi:3-isopropylmalate dehydrogenase
VIVATNLYGDILSDLASELSGSIGLAGSIMASDTHCCAQAQHGSAPDLAGKDKANPTSMILSVAMLIRWMGDKHGKAALQKAGDAMSAAVDKVLEDPKLRTPDLGGTSGCKAFGEAVAKVVG